MTRSFLIATVAALAITAPATAQGPGGRGGGQAKQERQAQQQHVQRQAPQRAERQAPQRMERQAQRAERPQRMERQMQRAERPQRMERQMQRAERPQRMERQMQRAERPQRMERQVQRAERSQRMERQVQRAERSQRVERQARRIERPQRLERQAQRAERKAPQRIERQAMRPQRQAERRQLQSDRGNALARNSQRIDRRQDRIAALNDGRAFRADRQRLDARQYNDRTVRAAYSPAQRDGKWQALAERARIVASRERVRSAPNRTLAMVGAPLDTRYYYDDYVPLGYRSTYYDTPDYYYRYDNDYGYLYRVRRADNIVSTLIPLDGGAFSIGQPMPIAYRTYNVPLAYQPYYYDTPDYYYRYGGGAIYQVDAGTQLISAVVALLSGQSLGVGQMLPASYSVYNVPYAYRSQYYDTPNSWYRYNDGVIYQVDPRNRLIQSAIPMYDDYYIGNPMPASWNSYNVPIAYRDIYYDTPEWDYRYADGAIYQIDPQSQVVRALVALVSGNNYAMGQVLPANYGVYNVPVGYRDRYYDTDQYAYRYDDGYVYRIDPRTRVINGMYDVVVA
ncbi:MAG TPA: hypothetical protein VHM21_01100 [Sphingomicrobium sp.]|nr:hypothetical protein [Sphingomicrobium sp.]